MKDVWQTIKIAEFEWVMTDPSSALLRVAGRARRRRASDGPRPALLVAVGGHASRFEALLAPPDRRGVLRAAYSVPAAAITPHASFSLELADGATIALPEPVEGAARLGPVPVPTALPGSGDAERRVAAAEQQVADAERRATEAERRVADADRRVAAAQERAAAAEASIEQRVAEGRAQARAEADTRAAEAAASLRQRLSDIEEAGRLHEAEARSLALEVESLREARAHSERELRDTLDSVRKMTLERDELSRQADAFDGVATKARERAGQAEAAHEKATARLNDLEIWRGELERRLAATTSELGAARVTLKENARDLAAMRDALVRAGAPSPSPASHAPAPAPTATPPVDLDALARRAEAEASRQAVQELEDAAARARLPV